MSLCVTLRDDHGEELFSANITHNLGQMAGEAGIYECLWHPEENSISSAHQLIAPLSKGLEELVANKSRFEAFNAPNSWGTWEQFVPWCAEYLQACRNHPGASIDVAR